jgi:hypothetical protein
LNGRGAYLGTPLAIAVVGISGRHDLAESPASAGCFATLGTACTMVA